LIVEENLFQINEDESMEYEDTNKIINIENKKIEDGISVQPNKVLNSCTNCLQNKKK